MGSADQRPPGLHVSSLKAGYAGHRVLHDVTLELPAGKITVLTGPAGGGKTTFVRSLISDSCTDFWQTSIVKTLKGRQSVQRQCPNDPNKMLSTVLVSSSVPEDLVSVEARRVLRTHWPPGTPVFDDLEPSLEKPVREVKLSCYRLASFTRAIDIKAEQYIFDEPDADLPLATIEMIGDRILALRHRATVLLVTHHLGLAARVADYAALMVEGEILETGKASGFFQNPIHPRTQRFVRMGN